MGPTLDVWGVEADVPRLGWLRLYTQIRVFRTFMSVGGDGMGVMTFKTHSLRLATAAVCAREGVDVAALPASELLELSGDVARLRRDADVLMAEVAAEIRRRSETADVGVGLAIRQGFRSAGELGGSDDGWEPRGGTEAHGRG